MPKKSSNSDSPSRPLDHLRVHHRDPLDETKVHVWTDGASKRIGNTSIGGWGVLMKYRDLVREYSGSEEGATNNRMELMGICVAVKNLANRNTAHQCIIYSDSGYCVNTLNVWWPAWERNGWTTSTGTPVKNVELIKEIVSALQPRMAVRWLKGHNGNEGNERADQLAVQARKELEQRIRG